MKLPINFYRLNICSKVGPLFRNSTHEPYHTMLNFLNHIKAKQKINFKNPHIWVGEVRPFHAQSDIRFHIGIRQSSEKLDKAQF